MHGTRKFFCTFGGHKQYGSIQTVNSYTKDAGTDGFRVLFYAGKEGAAVKQWAEWFYSSKQWKQTQASFLSARVYCERCSKPDDPVIAKIAHHKIWLTPQNIHDPAISLSWDNLEALCQTCHNREHHGNKAAKRYEINDKGELIPPIRHRSRRGETPRGGD